MKKLPLLNRVEGGIPYGWSHYPKVAERCPHTHQKGHWFYFHTSDKIKRGEPPDFEVKKINGKRYFNIQEVKNYIKNGVGIQVVNPELNLNETSELKGWAKFPGIAAVCPFTGMNIGWFNNHTLGQIREGRPSHFEVKQVNGRKYFNIQSAKDYMEKSLSNPKQSRQGKPYMKQTDPFWRKIQQVFIDAAISPVKGMSFQDQVKEEVYKMVIGRYQAEKDAVAVAQNGT